MTDNRPAHGDPDFDGASPVVKVGKFGQVTASSFTWSAETLEQQRVQNEEKMFGSSGNAPRLGVPAAPPPPAPAPARTTRASAAAHLGAQQPHAATNVAASPMASVSAPPAYEPQQLSASEAHGLGMSPQQTLEFTSGFNAGVQSMHLSPGVVKTEALEAPKPQRPLSQREKNREAVRNCRKRKKEHAMQLKERIEELMEDNAKLRLELQLGGDEHTNQAPLGAEEEQGLIEEMQALVRKAREEESMRGPGAKRGGAQSQSRSDTENHLRRKIQLYMERHQDHGRDRQKAIAFILGRLQRLVEPENITKQYLHIMTSSNHNMLEGDEWKELREELQLTSDQKREFYERRRYAKRLRTELDCAFEKMKSIVQRCRRNKKVGDSLNELTDILKPEQFARFVVWVHSNPACKDILDELWGKLLAKCDVHINREIQASPQAVAQIKRFQENSAALSIRLFSIADPRARVAIANLCVHPDVVLVDANNNVDKRGVRAVTRYMSYVTNAFDTQACEKTKSLRSLNVEERSIVSDQQDDKVTGTWKLSGVYIGRLRPRRAGANSPSAPPFGSGVTVAGAGFKLPDAIGSKDRGDAASGDLPLGLPPGPAAKGAAAVSPALSTDSGGAGAPDPILPKEEQEARTVTFNVIVEFSFADPVKPELITEMIISWDAMSLVNQLGLLKSPAKGVLPPPAEMPARAEPEEDGGGVPAVDSKRAVASAQGEAENAAQEPDGAAQAGDEGAGQTEPEASAAEGAGAAAPAFSKGRSNAFKLATLFQMEDPAARERLAHEILDPHCVFDDIHMGAKYKGVAVCLKYIERLRRAFPTFEITARVLSESKVVPDRVARRQRGGSMGSKPSDASVASPSSAHSPRPAAATAAGQQAQQLPDQFEMKWEVAGFYGGALVSERKPCQLNGKVFAVTSPVNAKITGAKLDIVAQDLMFQLGILRT